MTHCSKPSPVKKLHKGARAAMVLLTLSMLLPVQLLSAATQARPAAVAVSMPKRFHTTLRGEMTLTGNSSMTCVPTAGYAPTCAGAQTGANNGVNDKFNMVYLNHDTDPSTFNATSAQLDIPPGSDVRWAGLYWGGNVTQGVNGQAAPNAGISNTVWIKIPGGTYQNVNGRLVGSDETTGQSRSYGAFAEITQLVRGAQGGEYTIANIQTGTGVRDDLGASGGLFGGWSLLVIYADKTLPLRDFNVWDSYFRVAESTTGTMQINNFVTPLTGQFRTSIAAMVFEGDKGLPGDYMLLNGSRVSDTLHLANNVFNGGVTRFGAPITRNPAFVNSLGLDINTIDATGIIPNGATSALLTLPTTADNYFPAMVAMAIDIYEPQLVMNKAAEDVNAGYLLPGDIVRYTVALTNTGTDGALNTYINDPIPPNTTYLPGSLRVHINPGNDTGAKTDPLDADIAEYDGARNLVHYRIGRQVNPVGGGVKVGESAVIEFCVMINSGTPDGTIIPNTATALYNGTLLTATFEISSSASVTVQVRTPDLSVFKTDNGATAAPGDTVVYYITARNEAPFSIGRNVILTETLPAYTSFVAPPSWKRVGATNSYTRNIGSLGPGAFAVVTIGLKIDLAIPLETTQIDNVVIIGDDGTLGPETIITNNISYEHTPLRYVDLAVDKTDNVSVIKVGDVVTYLITVTNKGIVNANGVQIIDPLVKGMVQATWNCVAAAGSNCNAVAGTGAISTTANIGVKSYVLFTLRVLVAACDGLVPNKVTVIPPAGLTDPHPEDNTDLDVDTDGSGANILMNATFPPIFPGGTFTPTVVLGNYGPDVATNVSTTLALPFGFTIDQLILSQGTYDSVTGLWTVGTLQVGQIVTMSLRSQLPAPGGVQTPTVVLGNFGPDVATNVSTTLTLPAGFTVDQFILSQGSYNAVTGLWMVGTLQVGQTVTMSLRTQMTSTFSVGQSITLTVNMDSSAVGNSPQRSQIVIVVSEQPPVIAGPQFNGFAHYLPIVNR